MQYLVSGRLREPCLLSPAELVTLAVREWEVVMAWLGSGRARAYGRLSDAGGGSVVLVADTAEEARRLAASLPFAPYADWRIEPCQPAGAARALALALGADSRGEGG